MTDEEYVFHQTNNERKRNGFGDYKKKRQGGKTVKLPNDNITRKEWEKMNGEVVTFELNQPRSWEDYQQVPDNLKFDYLQYLWAQYKATPTMLADMLKIDRKKVIREQSRLGLVCPTKRGNPPKTVKNRWNEFIGKNEEKTIGVESYSPPKVITAGVDVSSIIKALAGSGAKLTIELTL